MCRGSLLSKFQLRLLRTHSFSPRRDKELSSTNFSRHQAREMDIPPKVQDLSSGSRTGKGTVLGGLQRWDQKLWQSFLTVGLLYDVFHSKMASCPPHPRAPRPTLWAPGTACFLQYWYHLLSFFFSGSWEQSTVSQPFSHPKVNSPLFVL